MPRVRLLVLGGTVVLVVVLFLAYAIAHYLSLAYYQGQWAVRLASDPLGRGWDLFGSADYTAQAHTLSPNTIWYVQVAALVCGHVIALALAHDRAVATFQTVLRRDPRPVLAPRAHGPLHGRRPVDPFSGLGERAHPVP